MKKHVILVSMIVATMFATSCSKDDGDNVEQPVAQEAQNEDNNKSEVQNEDNNKSEAQNEDNNKPEVQNAESRQIVIKADNGKILSEVETTDGYNFTFSKGNKLVLTDGETTYATLEIDGEAGSSSATFKGEISTKADNKSIYAVIAGQSPLSEVKTSTVSLADVVQSNCYFKSESFNYNANSELSVTLNDQNAYLVFEVSENQKKVNIGSGWYDVSGGKCYAAVPAGEVSGRFFGTKTAKSSEIYTITRTDVVDLGLSVLWCTSNATSTERDQKNWADAKTLAASVEGYDLPSADNFKELTGETQVKDVTVTISEKRNGTGTENGVTFSTDYGSVFFPAAGVARGGYAGIKGFYWSSSPDDANPALVNLAYIFNFDFLGGGVCLLNVDVACSVRLVRGL